MKIVIAGGTGQVGSMLLREFSGEENDIVLLTRSASTRVRSDRTREVSWDGMHLGKWTRDLDGADVVINLAGRSVNCRYGAKNRRLIMDSRVNSTRAIGRAIAEASNPPTVWLQASTATIYSHRFDAANDEATGILGGSEPNAPDTWRFSIDVAKAWEAAATEFELPATRTVLLRSAMTMSPDKGGIFDVLRKLTRCGLGGAIAGGKQFVSWIHERDFVDAVKWIIDREDLSGAINLCSSNPIPHSEFMRDLQLAAGVHVGLPATRWMVEIGTFLMRTESELVLKSRRVIPTRLLQSGFKFRFPNWADAAADLCDRIRNTHAT